MNVIEITAKKKTLKETIRLAAYCRVSSDSEDQLHFIRRTGQILQGLREKTSSVQAG